MQNYNVLSPQDRCSRATPTNEQNSHENNRTLSLVTGVIHGGGSPEPPKNDFASRILPAQLDKIAGGLEKGFVLQRDAAWMVKSSAHKNAYYVVAFFNGPGVSDVLGAWSCNGDPKAVSGMVLSANSQATEFSAWPNGARSKAGAWFTDEDCSNLLAYARRQKQ